MKNEAKIVIGILVAVVVLSVVMEYTGLPVATRVNRNLTTAIAPGQSPATGVDGATRCTVSWQCDGNYKYYQTATCAQSQKTLCPMGCSNGACLTGCTDSDGGMNTYVAGTCRDATQTKQDSCSGTSSVTEYYCSSNRCYSGSGYCPDNLNTTGIGGCLNGACRR